MKTGYKKIIAILLIAILSISMVKYTFAFSKMDVCNYTNWDTSGNYYDRKCTKDWKPAENEYLYQKELEAKRLAELQRQTQIKKQEEKKHRLTPVKHYTGSSAFIWNINTKNKEEINKLKDEIVKLKILNSKKSKLLKSYENKVVLLNRENSQLKVKNKQLHNFIDTFKNVFKKSNSQRIIDEKARKENIIEKIKRINAEKAKNRI